MRHLAIYPKVVESVEWNPMDYQGRRQDQVEGSYAIASMTLISFVMTLVLSWVVYIF